MAATRAPGAWERYGGAAGILFVLALLAEVVIAVGIPINQDDSVSKIATELHQHRTRALAIAGLSAVYAVSFLVYLWTLHDRLRGDGGQPRLSVLVLVGGVLFVTLHAVSDVGITGMLAAKDDAFASQQGQFTAYTLYLLTFALDSVGDVLGSVFAVATGLLVLRTGLLPRWLGYAALAIGVLFFLQGFGLGGVIAVFGLVLDLIAFVLLVIFVVASGVVMLRSRPQLG